MPLPVLKLPRAHGEQVVSPAAKGGWKVPGLQRRHAAEAEERPTAVLYVPPWQAWHVDPALMAYVPYAHSVQSLTLVVPCACVNVPAGQEAQVLPSLAPRAEE
jgi:hypothetical protein